MERLKAAQSEQATKKETKKIINVFKACFFFSCFLQCFSHNFLWLFVPNGMRLFLNRLYSPLRKLPWKCYSYFSIRLCAFMFISEYIISVAVLLFPFLVAIVAVLVVGIRTKIDRFGCSWAQSERSGYEPEWGEWKREKIMGKNCHRKLCVSHFSLSLFAVRTSFFSPPCRFASITIWFFIPSFAFFSRIFVFSLAFTFWRSLLLIKHIISDFDGVWVCFYFWKELCIVITLHKLYFFPLPKETKKKSGKSLHITALLLALWELCLCCVTAKWNI